MAVLSVDAINARSTMAWAKKGNWQALLSECYEYALPDRNPYSHNGSGTPQGSGAVQGSDKSSARVYDSTLQNAAVKLCNRLQYDLFPMGQHWGELVPGPFVEDGEGKTEIQRELKGLQKILFASIQLSNFDLAISEWLQELVVAGTAVMVTTRGDDIDPVIYRCVSQAHAAFLEGANGRIEFISIKHKLRLDQIEGQWSDATGLPSMKDNEKEPPEYDLIEVTYFDRKDGIWRYEVLVCGKAGSSKREFSKIVEREYMVTPITVARWSKSVEEVQGRSLVMAALPDARVLSAVKNFLLKQAALAIAGVFLVKNDGVVNVNNVRVFPGATISVRSTGGNNGASIVPMQVGGDTQLAQFSIQDLRDSIDKIMLNTGLPDISDGVRSATEFIERLKDMQQSIGAPFSRILREGIVPMLEAHLQVMTEIGIVPEAEGGTFRLNSGDIELRFTSPLVQGQAARDIERFVQAIQIIQQTGGEQAFELLGLNIKVEDLPAWIWDKLQADPNLKRTDAEKKALETQAGQMAAAQQSGVPMDQMQEGQPGGEAMPQDPTQAMEMGL